MRAIRGPPAPSAGCRAHGHGCAASAALEAACSGPEASQTSASGKNCFYRGRALEAEGVNMQYGLRARRRSEQPDSSRLLVLLHFIFCWNVCGRLSDNTSRTEDSDVNLLTSGDSMEESIRMPFSNWLWEWCRLAWLAKGKCHPLESEWKVTQWMGTWDYRGL